MNRPVFQKPEAYIRARAVPIGIVFVLCVAHRTGQRGLIYSAGFDLPCSLISARAAPAGVLCTFITCQDAPVCKQLYAHLPTCTGSYALVCRRLPVCTCPYTQGLYVLAGLHLPVYTGPVHACRYISVDMRFTGRSKIQIIIIKKVNPHGPSFKGRKRETQVHCASLFSVLVAGVAHGAVAAAASARGPSFFPVSYHTDDDGRYDRDKSYADYYGS